MGLQDPSNRRPANTMPEVLHGALDPRIAPRVVLAGHAQNEVPDVCLDTWTAGSPPYLRTRATCQLAVPTQNRVGGGNGRHLHQCGTSQLVSQPRQTPPFLITELQASPAQVRPQHSVLFPQERDDLFLLAQDATAQGPDEPLERKHRRILRQPRSIQFWDNTGYRNRRPCIKAVREGCRGAQAPRRRSNGRRPMTRSDGMRRFCVRVQGPRSERSPPNHGSRGLAFATACSTALRVNLRARSTPSPAAHAARGTTDQRPCTPKRKVARFARSKLPDANAG